MKRVSAIIFAMLMAITIPMSALAVTASVSPITSTVISVPAILKASQNISSYGAGMYTDGTKGKLLTDIDISATNTMSVLGCSQVDIQEKVGSNWVSVSSIYNYYKYNAMTYMATASFYGLTSGKTYRTLVYIYAENSSGLISTGSFYTSSKVCP